MSGTRSHSPKAPATNRVQASPLVIVAHGDRGGTRGNGLALRVAKEAERLPGYQSVHTCFVRGEPTIRSVAADLPPGRATVYPLFMSDGYYVQHTILQQMGANGNGTEQIRIMRPFGLSPLLPEIIAKLARSSVSDVEFDFADAALLLAAHGSKKSSESREATLSVAESLADKNHFAAVETAFLEEAPFLTDQLALIERPIIVVGLFVGEGLHGAVDLPDAVAASGREDVVLTEPLSRSRAVVDLICRELSANC